MPRAKILVALAVLSGLVFSTNSFADNCTGKSGSGNSCSSAPPEHSHPVPKPQPMPVPPRQGKPPAPGPHCPPDCAPPKRPCAPHCTFPGPPHCPRRDSCCPPNRVCHSPPHCPPRPSCVPDLIFEPSPRDVYITICRIGEAEEDRCELYLDGPVPAGTLCHCGEYDGATE